MGPGVPADRRTEIFKPYFTTQKTGTGLGLAVVQQIVLGAWLGYLMLCQRTQGRGLPHQSSQTGGLNVTEVAFSFLKEVRGRGATAVSSRWCQNVLCVAMPLAAMAGESSLVAAAAPFRQGFASPRVPSASSFPNARYFEELPAVRRRHCGKLFKGLNALRALVGRQFSEFLQCSLDLRLLFL